MKLANTFKPALGIAAVACLALALASRPAAAVTATTTFQVTATVPATCIVSATPMAFGNYTGTLVNSTSTVTVTCTNTTPYHVQLSKGANGGSVTTRQMKGTTNGALLNYAMYYYSAMTKNWSFLQANMSRLTRTRTRSPRRSIINRQALPELGPLSLNRGDDGLSSGLHTTS